MKKVLLTIGVALATVAGAQAQVSYGLKAGVNLGKYSNFPSGQSVNTSFNVTGFADLPVSPNFSIQPGVSLQGKGTKYSVSEEVNFNSSTLRADADYTVNVMSIEIPVNAVYYIPTGDAGKVFLGAGPYIGFNVSGKEKIKGSIIADQGSNKEVVKADESNSLKLSGSDKDLNVIDAGLNFMVGYKFSNGFLLNAGYNLGLTNIVANADKTVSNRVWSFGVGFQF